MAKVLRIKNEHGDWVSVPCITGDSAYAVAKRNGFDGTEEEWLESLKPHIQATQIEGGYRIEITDSNGTGSFDILNGKDGEIDDEAYLKKQGAAAYINYGDGYEVNIGASQGVDITTSGTVTIEGNNAAVFKSSTDVAATFSGKRISNISKPVAGTDAVTLQYLIDNGYIKRSENGNIDLSALETKISGGSFVVQALAYGMSVSGNRIQDVGTPTMDGDATPKKYVDDAIKTAIKNIPVYNGEVESV